MSAGTECPLCGGESVPWAQVDDWLYGFSESRVCLARCRNCDSRFQDPMPSPDLIPRFYGDGYWLEGELGGIQRRYVEWVLRRDLMRWFNKLRLEPNAYFADLGCSRGDWLAEIARSGFRVLGVESDPRAAQFARSKHGLDILHCGIEKWSPAEGMFDAISAFHILEHLLAPRQLLRTCHRALRQGGRLLLRVPNVASLQARFCGLRWKGLEPPRHIINFSLRAVTELVRSEGFRVTESSTWSLRDGPPGWSSSLFPYGEPTRQQVKADHHGWAVIFYAALTWFFVPIEMLAAGLHRGGMTTLIAVKT